MPIFEQLMWLVIAVPYVIAWWTTLRWLFGRWFQPLEWIPVAILAFGIPYFILDVFASRGEALGYWLAGAWAALPAPILLHHGLRRWRTKQDGSNLPIFLDE